MQTSYVYTTTYRQSVDFNVFGFVPMESTILKYFGSTNAHLRVFSVNTINTVTTHVQMSVDI